MPVQIYKKRNPNNAIGDAILAGTQGFVQGRQMREQTEDRSIANQYKQAQIGELNRKASAYGKALPEGFVMTPDGEIRQDPGYFNVSKEREKAAIKAEEDARAMAMFNGMGSGQGGGTPGGTAGVPVGTTMRLGRYNIPLNPKLTDAEQQNLGAQETYREPLDTSISLIKSGVLNSKLGDMGRTYRQGAASSNIPLTTYYDPQLQRLQSKLNKAKELMFERGGKALTPTEQAIVGQAFKLTGKNDEQILEDIASADNLIETESRLALGGANAAGLPMQSQVPQPAANLPMSDPLEQEAQAAIAAGKDPNLVNQRLQQLRARRG